MTQSTAHAIAFLPPDNALNDYILMSQPSDQPHTIPTTFRDAMTVRNEVFGKEQGIPREYEWDEDDARSSHWVIYSTPDGKDPKRIPIGTIRAVPFPHPPHPENEGRYFELEDNPSPPSPPSKEPPPFIVDRATTFHNGKEAYIKLGRISVLKEYRGKGLAKILTMTALEWLKKNPTYFNLLSRDTGDLTDVSIEEVGVWRGLVCVHAQQIAAAVWTKWRFGVDQGMGMWYEAGIPHVGMFQRLDIEK